MSEARPRFSQDADALIVQLRALVEAGIGEIELPREPATLYDPVRYVLEGGGKRFRPTLLLLACEAYGGDARAALPAALAVEVFHNFTLVHDDIMDHAEARRGRPAVHVAWSEATAILSGDLMMGLSYELLARALAPDLAEVLAVYSRMVHRLCQGQALDDSFARRGTVTVDEYLHMIDGKTAALLEATLEIGGMLGGADDRDRPHLVAAGRALGRAFQVQDDLLDLIADDPRWGKVQGGDLIEGKKALLLLLALERAEGEELAWFERIASAPGLPAADVPEARRRMEALGVIGAAREAVAKYSDEAAAHFAALPEGPARAALLLTAERLRDRVH